MQLDSDRITVMKQQLLLKPIITTEKKTTSGIIVPGQNKTTKLELAEVIAVGYEVNEELRKHKAEEISPGDKVLYDTSYCTEFTMDSKEKENEVFVTVNLLYVHIKL